MRRLKFRLGMTSVLAFALCAGCASFPNLSGSAETAPGEEKPPGKAAQASHQTQPSDTDYFVEVKPLDGKPQKLRLPMGEGSFVQDAVTTVKANRRFKDMEIIVYRRDPQSGQSQRMGSKYDPEAKRVDLEFDYALHPGDIVEIVELDASPMDDALARFIPFGPRFGTKRK